ncbi:MAG: agmatinase [Cyanobacteriota bacterium]
MSMKDTEGNIITPFEIEEELTNYNTSKYHIICVPYSETVSYLRGSDKAPEAIIKASAHVEMYDIDSESEPCFKGISLKEINVNTDIKQIWKNIGEEVDKCLKDGKFPVILGGEHSISHGGILACQAHSPDICILQIDAHSDIRSEFNNDPYNHACALRHAFNENIPIIQVGIRAIDKEEHLLIKNNPNKIKTFFASKTGLDIKEVIKSITNTNVYLTIDLDGFDPSVIPAVGTPEPGGLNWYEVINLLETLFKQFNVMAADIVELAPNETSTPSDFTAAKLLYKLLSFKT